MGRRSRAAPRSWTAETVRQLVLRLTSVDDDAAAVYAAQHARLVSAGQVMSARLAMAFLGATWRVAPPAVDPARALAPVLVTAETPSATSPIIRVRTRLAEGDPWPAALTVAASYGAGLAIGDVQAAMRRGLDATAEAHRRRVRWAKDLSASACEWCQDVATQTYGSADAVPFHPGDTCGVVPTEE